MKRDTLIAQVLAGKPLLVVEYRETKTETINRKVVKAGESSVMPMSKHKVLVGNDSYEVAEFLPDNTDIKSVKAPFNARDMVVLEVESMEKTKWGNRINGTFHGKLEA